MYAAPRWATIVKYGKVELMPPSPAEIPAAIGQFAGLVKSAMTMQWRHTPVKVSRRWPEWPDGICHLKAKYILFRTVLFHLLRPGLV